MSAISIELENAGKKFLRQYILRNINLKIRSGDRLAVTGSNGSGKSTLLQILSGYVSLSEGKFEFHSAGNVIEHRELYKFISVAAPYLDLHEELSLEENLSFFFSHKNPRRNQSVAEITRLSGLEKYKDRQLKFFSSGMKQRVRITMALNADVPVVMLDEPLSNLDAEGVKWFQEMLSTLPEDVLLIICSNHIQEEIKTCNSRLEL